MLLVESNKMSRRIHLADSNCNPKNKSWFRRVKGWIRLPLDPFFMPAETPLIAPVREEVGISSIIPQNTLPDPWEGDWNDSALNHKMWLDKMGDRE